MNIAYYHPDEGGCTYYRADLPMETMKRNGVAKTYRITRGDHIDQISEKLDTAEIMQYQRPADNAMQINIDRFHDLGKKVVVDFDDNYWCVSPLSPHYQEFGLLNATATLDDGSQLPIWEDGKNINLAANAARLKWMEETARQADLITTTTEILAEKYRQFNANVAVLPNCIDPPRWKKLPLQKRNHSVRLFWAGGASHYEDWMLLRDVIPPIMKKYPQVHLVIMGSLFKGPLKTVPESRMEFHEWETVTAYPYKCAMLDVDIALIPLKDSEFNACKSPIKWAEQAALGTPAVVSYVSPYKEIYNGSNAVMIHNNDPEEWIDGISALIEDPLLRAKIGGEAERYCLENFNIHKRYKDWVEAYSQFSTPKRPTGDQQGTNEGRTVIQNEGGT